MMPGAPDLASLGRIVRPADYVRVLATPMRLRSPHFAVHHLEGRPLPTAKPATRTGAVPGDPESTHAPVTASLSTELSTAGDDSVSRRVDDLPAEAGEYPDARVGPQRWLGLVVPKKHAKRAVTRTLVKRQIRNAAQACAPSLASGLWVVRQRAPFDAALFPSAASDALKQAARAELRALFERAARGERDPLKPRGASGGGAPRGKSGRPGRDASNPPASPEGTTPCAA